MNDEDENKTVPTLDSATASVTMDVKPKIPETCKQLSSIEESTAQSILNTKQVIIDKPFSLDIDVTDETPINEIPISHPQFVKAKWKADAQTEKDLKAALEALSVNPDVEQFLFNEIHRTVSHLDDHIINIVFHAALSTYFKPLNLALKAESGSGKTYSTIQSISFLPDEDIVTLSYISPKVLIHSNGTRKVDVDGKAVNFDEIPQPIKPERADEPDYLIYERLMSVYRENVKKYRELEKQIYYEVDLRNKIYVMMEGIDQKTFTMLKTTMSRDNEEHGFNDSVYVDDKGRNHKTRLVGSPVMIFNSVDAGEYNNEFATRCLTATPNTSPEKIRRAMEISNQSKLSMGIREGTLQPTITKGVHPQNPQHHKRRQNKRSQPLP